MKSQESDLVDTLQDAVGDHLRVVGTYTADGYDIAYLRDDVRERVTESQIDRVHEDLVLRGIGKEHLEDLFDAGELHCSMYRFDESTVFHFVGEPHTGLYVAIDSDAEIDLPSFAETCRDLVGSEERT